ncbi:hypothetical protein [Pseudomonas oryzihabitans]|uniref:hypothetical protein n=1 Tax=Pseudomonas oryzihabitans TaxID=47885 RepID=UPI000A77DD2B|nr:hypothetical protein [Pseudomonas oryzihabitans]
MRAYLAMMVTAVALSLVGCDNDAPPKTVKAPPMPAAAPAPAPAAPPVASAAQGSAADLRALRLDPLPAKAFVLPAPPLKKRDLAKNGQLKRPAAPKAPPAAAHPLDLSMPGEVEAPQALTSRRVAPKKAENTVAEANLLPQLFRGKDDPGRFELGGRVISRDRSDDFEGAEVELRFRR